ncbi:MAG: hypothetical protein JNL85_12805 [Rubrivivax sp.]|nr:hypothetical protein [Rubrivivax sp.]
MSHTPAATAIVKKRDGTATNAMAQPQVQSYLLNLLGVNRHANLKQALNDVFSGKGKASGSHIQDGLAVLHASSGNMQQSVTLFYVMQGAQAIIFAMGEHAGSSSYKVSDFGQPSGTFVQGAKIAL